VGIGPQQATAKPVGRGLDGPEGQGRATAGAGAMGERLPVLRGSVRGKEQANHGTERGASQPMAQLLAQLFGAWAEWLLKPP
jgi:hypothetical protein